MTEKAFCPSAKTSGSVFLKGFDSISSGVGKDTGAGAGASAPVNQDSPGSRAQDQSACAKGDPCPQIFQKKCLELRVVSNPRHGLHQNQAILQ